MIGSGVESVAANRLEHLLLHLQPREDRREEALEAVGGHGVPRVHGVAASRESTTLANERGKASFNTRELTYALDGGQANTLIKEKLYHDLLQQPEFSPDCNVDDLTTPQFRELTMARIKRLVAMHFEKREPKERELLGTVLWQICPSTATRLGVHTGLFTGSVLGNASEKTLKEYTPKILGSKIFGCFCMTELGHGSNAAAFETIAAFDKEKQEFDIHSPTLTSKKWWIGGLAETATHGVVFARLLVDEKDYGVHTFLVQLRDVATHQPLPGITIGDCGKKLGLNGIDNGWAEFNHVRIPRDQMLSKYAEVKPDGTYWKASKKTLALQRVALIGARTGIVTQSSVDATIALTVAIRYGAIRRQFGKQDEPEIQILDYQTHLRRLIPSLAEVTAILFAGRGILGKYHRLLVELKSGNSKELGDVHAASAGLKAFASWTARDIIILCRDCCGGHGYSAYNRIGRIIQDFQVQTTWDGDNTVLAQQTARYLVKSFTKALKGEPLVGSLKYMARAQDILSSKMAVEKPEDLLKTENQILAFQWHTAKMAERVLKRMQSLTQSGMSSGDVWNNCLVDLVALAKSHCEWVKLSEFLAGIEPHKGNPSIHAVLKKLMDLYALHRIENDLAMFRDHDFLSFRGADHVRTQVRNLCFQLRPEAVSIIDAFNLPDGAVDAQISREDGDIYKHYFERVQRAPQTSPVPPYFEKLIKPLTNAP